MKTVKKEENSDPYLNIYETTKQFSIEQSPKGKQNKKIE